MYPPSLPRSIARMQKIIGPLNRLERKTFKTVEDGKMSPLEWVMEMRPGKPDDMEKLILSLPAADRPLAVKAQNEKGQTLLHLGVIGTEFLPILLEQIPQNERFGELLRSDYQDNTPAHEAASMSNKNPNALKLFLNSLSPEERVTLLQARDSDRNGYQTVFELVKQKFWRISGLSESGIFECMKAIISSLSPLQWYKFVTNTYDFFDSVIKEPELLKLVIDAVPEYKRVELLLSRSAALIKRASKFPASLEIIFNYALGDNKKALEAYHFLSPQIDIQGTES